MGPESNSISVCTKNKQTTDTRRHVHKIIGYVRTEQNMVICKLRRGASGDQSH